MQIKNLKEKTKYIKHLSDYLSHYFGFEFLEISEKSFSKKNIIEDDKIKVLKIFKKQLPKKKKEHGFFYKKQISTAQRKKGQNAFLGLNILNIDGALAEALLVKTAITILKAEGYSDFFISLNAIGGKDAQKNWKKQLSNYYKEHKNILKNIEIKKIISSPDEIYFSDKEYLVDINENAPQPLEFLLEEDIELFQHFIDYLETFNMDYSVDSKMIGEKQVFSKTIFKIFAKNPKTKNVEEVGFGGRYDDVASKTLGKKKFNAISLSLYFLKKNKKKLKLKEQKIDINLLKLGTSAEMKFLDVLEVLSSLNIPINFNIQKKKLSEQIQIVSDGNNNDGFVLILGETEARNDKIMVKNNKDASQNTIYIKDLKKYLKKFI